MLIALAIGLLLLHRAAGGTPIGRTLHHWLVEVPADRLSRISRGQVLLVLTLAGIALALVWLLADDGRMLVAFGLPDIAGFAVAIDLGTLLDVTLVAIAAATTVKARAALTWLARRPAPRRPRPRAIRVRRARPPANDDEHRPRSPREACNIGCRLTGGAILFSQRDAPAFAPPPPRRASVHLVST